MFRATPETTLVDFFRRFYQPARNLAPTSVVQYEVQINILQKYANHMRTQEVAAARARGVSGLDPTPMPLTLADLCDELLSGAMQWQVQRGRSADTANKIISQIKPLWNFARRSKLVKMRCRSTKYRVLKKSPIALLPEEFQKLLDAAGTRGGTVGEVPAAVWWTAFLLLMFSTGARISAVYRCRTEKLDLERGEITLLADTQKQKGEQQLDLLPGAVRWLRELRLQERRVQRVLGDYPWKVRSLRDDYTMLFVEAGIYKTFKDVPRSLKLHAIRKTLASHVAAKFGIAAACERLGHSTTKVTESYIDPRFLQKRRIVDMVPDPSPARLAKQTLSLWRPESEAAG